MKDSKIFEVLFQGLTVVTFVLFCWVAHRALKVRAHCLESSILRSVRVRGSTFESCRLESRLDLVGADSYQTPEQADWIQVLDESERLKDVLSLPAPRVSVEVVEEEPYFFELNKIGLRIGRAWVENPFQVRRAVIMATLQATHPFSYANQYQLETITDFLLLAAWGDDRWSVSSSLRFATTPLSFAQYCDSPFRSLAHHKVCGAGLADLQTLETGHEIWGFRPLLAAGLWRVFTHLELRDQLRIMEAIKHGPIFPSVPPVSTVDGKSFAEWYKNLLESYLGALNVSPSPTTQLAIQQTLNQLEVEAPTRWELSFDLTHTPMWKEIVEQLRRRSQLNRRERVLIFTPAGNLALPSGLPVSWAPSEVQSQKHVLVACEWPKPNEAVNVRARQTFAQQSCAKLTNAFWD